MKKLALIVVATLLVTAAGVSAAGFGGSFGSLTTARAIGMGKASFSGGVGIADQTTAFGAFTYGMSEYFDGRIKLGLLDRDFGDTEFTLGVDFKYQIWEMRARSSQASETSTGSRHPIELAVGGMLEWVGTDFIDIWQLGGVVHVSYPMVLSNGMLMSIYGRGNLRVENYSVDVATPGYGDDDSELEFGLNGGVMFGFTDALNGYAEFQLDGNDGLFLGLEFLIM